MIRTKDVFKTSFSGLAVHRNRSLLTILGIVIGITSVVMVMSIGASAEQYVIGAVQRFGARNVFVLPGGEPQSLMSASATLLNDSLVEKDYEDLKKTGNVPNAVQVVPFSFGNIPVAFESEQRRLTVIGTTEGAQKNFDLGLGEGRFIDDFDVNDQARIAVIGDRVGREMFGSVQPLGQKIRVKDVNLQIVGVLEPQGQGSFIDFDNSIFAPYNVVQREILGVKHFQRLAIEAESEEAIPLVVLDVERTLRENHNIDNPEKDDFSVQTQEDIAESVGMITTILTVLLASVAAISLVVGGVGIMNIMYVSVTERTREIGLRKALGATNRNILAQFLSEAMILTIGGGIVGVLAGVGLSALVTYGARTWGGLELPFAFSGAGAILGVGVSSVIGLVFGVFPAREAARKSPIEALRGDQ